MRARFQPAALALIVAALVAGATTVMTVGGGRRGLGLPAFGLPGFVGAVLGVLWLLRSIARRQRQPGP